MKKLGIALIATASLSVAACNSNNQDSVNNAELNQPAADDLNAIGADAANDAASAEAEALGTQQQQLDQAPPAADNSSTNAVTPTDDDEQNVSGM